jgi:threonine dehydrogenase-like Zn-dependent dehydrogenase
MAQTCNADVFNYDSDDDVVEVLKQMTGGRGPDACIDCVGMEAHDHDFVALYDSAKQKLKLSFDRPKVLRQAIQACRKGGTVSVPGVYGGLLDKIPFGSAFGKGLTLKMGQTHVHSYLQPLLRRIEAKEIDPSFVVTHRLALDDAPKAYRTFRDKQDGCIKVVLDPWQNGTTH